MSKHSQFDAHLRFARALRTPDEAATKRITEHFNAQKDLFTQCQKCHAHLKGTLAEIQAHVCADVAALIGHAAGN